MRTPFHLRRAGIALAGAALLLAGAAGADAASGPQPGTGQRRPAIAAAALANPAMTPGSELQFIAVAPCRILDTRIAGGALTASSRDFSAVTPYDAQGGLADGCGIPATAVSLQLNLGAISQGNSTGFVKGWASGSPEPNASLVNYDPSGAVANMVTVPLSASATFTLRTNRSAQVFADVAGYYVQPLYATIDGSDGATASVLNGIASGLVDVVRTDIGEYQVTFNRNVTACVPAATDYTFPAVHEISVDASFSQDSTVFVSVKDSSTGVPDDTVFHLSLTC
jgi:hypothetical protein